jgi:hypothetical protein
MRIELVKLIFWIALISCVMGCSSQSTEISQPLRTKYNSPDMQASFIRELEYQKIPHSISTDGYVLYSRKHMKRVDDVSANVIEKFNRPGARYHKKELKEKFIVLLRRDNVSFTEEPIDGVDWIVWQRNDDAKVRKLMDEVEQNFSYKDLKLMR